MNRSNKGRVALKLPPPHSEFQTRPTGRGRRTYGDAGVRKAVALPDGSAVILSVAKYYSPDGKAIQDNGVTPNVLQAENSAAADTQLDDLPDAAPDDNAKKPATDELLNKALQFCSSRFLSQRI